MKFRESAPLIVHLGLLVVLIAGIVTYYYGNVEEIEVAEGQTISLKKPPIKLRLQKFNIIPSVNKMEAEEFASQILISQEDKPLINYTLKVNNPLYLKDAVIYQMRYRIDIEKVQISFYKKGKYLGNFFISPNEKKYIDSIGMNIEYMKLVPDFVINDKGEFASRSKFFNNPAVQLKIYSNGKEKNIWAFTSLMSKTHSSAGETEFVIDKIYKKTYSGIRISQDPGAVIAYAGFVLLVLGSFMSAFIKREVRGS